MDKRSFRKIKCCHIVEISRRNKEREVTLQDRKDTQEDNFHGLNWSLEDTRKCTTASVKHQDAKLKG